jgi:hypothetical protein
MRKCVAEHQLDSGCRAVVQTTEVGFVIDAYLLADQLEVAKTPPTASQVTIEGVEKTTEVGGLRWARAIVNEISTSTMRDAVRHHPFDQAELSPSQWCVLCDCHLC